MSKHAILLIILLIFICSCKPVTDKDQVTKSEYFDVKKYFETEIARLSKSKPTIQKTVGVNGALETKSIVIDDWAHELSAFRDAEINRVSWKGLFTVSKNDSVQTYRSQNDKLPIKELKVTLRSGKVHEILIVIQNKNILYNSSDTLTYIANALYRVEKQQNIRFLSDKNYLIEGIFQ